LYSGDGAAASLAHETPETMTFADKIPQENERKGG
jgi:hypothetical protein